jgi:hypothetical protein
MLFALFTSAGFEYNTISALLRKVYDSHTDVILYIHSFMLYRSTYVRVCVTCAHKRKADVLVVFLTMHLEISLYFLYWTFTSKLTSRSSLTLFFHTTPLAACGELSLRRAYVYCDPTTVNSDSMSPISKELLESCCYRMTPSLEFGVQILFFPMNFV